MLTPRRVRISATSVNFGSYNVFNGSPTDSTGTVTYRCNGSAHNITVGLTQGASASFNQRQMQKGSESLTYNLFVDASRTNIWGGRNQWKRPCIRSAIRQTTPTSI
jgi:spore coat protein U-like protein